jgi:hypothetical protein
MAKPQSPPPANGRRKVEWDLIEPDWRAGVLSKEQLAKKYGVSRAAMEKHFGKKGIARDLKGKIRAKTSALLAEEALAATDAPVSGSGKTATEQDIVDANATVQKTLVLTHREDIKRARQLCLTMLGELEAQSDRNLMRRLIEALIDDSPEGKDTRAEIASKVISLGTRVSSMNSLAQTLRTLVQLERQAFGLDDPDEDKGNASIDEAVRRVQERMSNGGG